MLVERTTCISVFRYCWSKGFVNDTLSTTVLWCISYLSEVGRKAGHFNHSGILTMLLGGSLLSVLQ